ncbi:uncharacterized protein UMAG_04749 [Mycosarcoma maydis]|uniref:Amine oxidase domain-containing protein n=1 Tax=Mycosarcoma maydis TaxID=5270 RepID=A0A0D1DW12_MYCMD|nr:uncharacterized protein UMAG_04749 [Ustilago maydis 521]KIS66685.1 hypothetical protein UMAG_04749 [Ustilago maydis 521]|eukprot:XP_011391627.1 hypothetical protein UMAG_04749 [Ustilago maydis 521]
MKIAVVGGGVSGLSSVWALNEYSSHQVHLFEPLPWIGGHANTVSFASPTSASPASAATTPVDTGFIVFNRVTYPNFLRFLQLTGVEILNSDMSFSVTRFISSLGGYGGFEWAGGSPAALFCQASNLVNPAHWRMVWDIVRFNQQSVDYLRECRQKSNKDAQISIGEWLDQRDYSTNFRRNYLIPMTASIWSTPPDTALSSFPALTLLRFMHNHHLLQILDRPQWLTIKNGSRSYVDRILSRLPEERIHQGNQHGHVVAAWIDGRNAKWTLKTADGHKHSGWDRIIFASHADDTLKMLLEGEAEGLGVGKDVIDTLATFRFSENTAVLHADTRLMPTRRQAWSAWNFLAETIGSSDSTNAKVNAKQVGDSNRADVDRVSLTYWMNLLQSLPETTYGPVFVTLNPTTDPSSPYTPRPDLVLRRQTYTHPLYTPDTVLAQAHLRTLQGTRGAFFVGAWTNYGFHEDGFSSGLRAADAIDAVYLPFDIKHAERDVPNTKLLACKLVESVHGCAKSWMVTWSANITLMVLVHLLALVELAFVLLGGRKQWTDGLATIKTHFKDSLRNDTKNIKST